MDFQEIVREICRGLEELSRTDPDRIAGCKTGEDFGALVVEMAESVRRARALDFQVHYTRGGHSFPDVVVEFADGGKYGIEVKSSSSKSGNSWKINGNSVLGSTREDVTDTYLIFGKTAKGHQAFRWKRYEDCVANVAVTHSPRYAIDMDVAPEDTFFARSGLSYQQLTEDPDPIGRITDYFRSQGQRAWWLAESSPAVVRMFEDLPVEKKEEFLGYGFARFPELLSESTKKYARFALWLVTEQSVVSASLRDKFSASGRVDIPVNGKIYRNVPRKFATLRKHRRAILRELDNAPAEALREDWGYEGPLPESPEARLAVWIQLAAEKLSDTGISEYGKETLLSDLMLAEK